MPRSPKTPTETPTACCATSCPNACERESDEAAPITIWIVGAYIDIEPVAVAGLGLIVPGGPYPLHRRTGHNRRAIPSSEFRHVTLAQSMLGKELLPLLHRCPGEVERVPAAGRAVQLTEIYAQGHGLGVAARCSTDPDGTFTGPP